MSNLAQRAQNRTAPPVSIVIFGASGDLTQRKLIPALYNLACGAHLSSQTRVIGVGRTSFDDESFRQHLRDGVQTHARLEEGCEDWNRFSERLAYIVGDYEDPDTYQQLEKELKRNDQEAGTGGNRLFHMAIPPRVFSTVIQQLAESGLNQGERGWARLVVEKPFGRDLETAEDLNRQIHQVFKEDQVFRIDHYLGKETVQNILTLRFANAIFEPIWNRNYIDHVQITVAEDVGVSDRAGFYDQTGVLRDMFQNHVLQLVALTAMEPPVAFEADAFRDEKVNVLRAIRPVDRSLIGQYGGKGKKKAYRQESGVPDDSDTATFAALRLFIDNWRWRDVPFYLRSGKRMATKSTAIAIEFKQVPHLMFPTGKREDLPPNILYLCIQPHEGIHLQLQSKMPGAGMATHAADIHYDYAQDFDEEDLPGAYERLLLEVIYGDATLFSRADEIELAWELMDPVLDQKEKMRLCTYEPGSWGPERADDFIEQDGRHWHYGCRE